MLKLIKEDEKRILDLDAEEGSAMRLMATTLGHLLEIGASQEKQDKVLAQMKSGDYAWLVGWFDYYFGSLYEIRTTNQELYDECVSGSEIIHQMNKRRRIYA